MGWRRRQDHLEPGTPRRSAVGVHALRQRRWWTHLPVGRRSDCRGRLAGVVEDWGVFTAMSWGRDHARSVGPSVFAAGSVRAARARQGSPWCEAVPQAPRRSSQSAGPSAIGSDPQSVEPGRRKLDSIHGGSPPLAASRQRSAADCARSLQVEIDPRPMDIVALHADIDWVSLDIVPLPAGRDSHSDDRARWPSRCQPPF